MATSTNQLLRDAIIALSAVNTRLDSLDFVTNPEFTLKDHEQMHLADAEFILKELEQRCPK